MFRVFLTSVFLVLGAVNFAVGQPWEEGEHYDIVSPVLRTSNPEKIEVMEFFWFGCGHCYTFEPLLAAWKNTLADDVVFKGSPAIWNSTMEIHAKVFYTAEVLGISERINPVVFRAINQDRKPLTAESDIATLFESIGVLRSDFFDAFNSFGVGSQVRQASSRARSAKITGTPEIVINGKYRITTRKAGNQTNMLKIADYLIEKERGSTGS